MPQDYARRSFIGDVYFPNFEEGKILGLGTDGIVSPIDLPVLRSLIFNQTTPSTHWHFTHDFGIRPFVAVYDTAGTNITYAVNVSCTDTTVDIETEDNLLTGRVEVYSLGVEPTSTPIPPNTGLTKVTEEFTINSAIAINADYATSIELAKTYQILKFSCATPIRIRVYISQDHQTADLNRASDVLPTGDHGLVFEAITSDSISNINTSPVPTGYNLDDSSTTYITVTNLSADSINNLSFEFSYLALQGS
jgi:hypothetical protein